MYPIICVIASWFLHYYLLLLLIASRSSAVICHYRCSSIRCTHLQFKFCCSDQGSLGLQRQFLVVVFSDALLTLMLFVCISCCVLLPCEKIHPSSAALFSARIEVANLVVGTELFRTERPVSGVFPLCIACVRGLPCVYCAC